MFLVLQIDAVPDLECLRSAVEIFLLKAVELDDFGVACDDLYLVTFRCPAPLRCADLVAVQSEGVTAAAGFPTETGLRKPTPTRLFGEV